VADTRVTWGLVLSGGRSRRMGRDKALLISDGQTQLARMVALLARHVDRVFVSAREDQADDPERSRYSLVVDRLEGIGPVAGILAAFDRNPEVDWLVVACDLPNVDDTTIELLLAGRRPGQAFTAYRSNYDGLPEPLCAIYGPDARAILEKFVADGITCPRKMMIRSGIELLEQPRSDALDNVNTPAELENSRLGMAK